MFLFFKKIPKKRTKNQQGLIRIIEIFNKDILSIYENVINKYG